MFQEGFILPQFFRTRFMNHPRHCAPEKPVALIAPENGSTSRSHRALEPGNVMKTCSASEFLDYDLDRIAGTKGPRRWSFEMLRNWSTGTWSLVCNSCTVDDFERGATGASTAKVWVALFIMALLSCLCSPFDCGEM